ncbi:hypothetical protein CEE37_01080 [candidate division LCP-89 bacterium B3_LCP]|uniref:SGNH hydrolase-type esterase domain-containing protein n=1 Tax=candidate division LCP-89 bacterium B3_LCP TaxID=2012998 RepID=A0A532V587_UNCL8|nr:MAG: hypothetical protein CEE37_01080 [candidate division LCP-89 bacterium B3_LCP]
MMVQDGMTVSRRWSSIAIKYNKKNALSTLVFSVNEKFKGGVFPGNALNWWHLTRYSITGFILLSTLMPLTNSVLHARPSIPSDPLFVSLAVILILYILSILALFAFFRRNAKVKKLVVNNIVLIAATFIVLSGLKLADFVLGMVIKERDFIFTPNTTALYDTPEFSYTASINYLGFRGPDPDLKKDSKTYKILMLGDSFTFGWGLEFEDTWPWVAQNMLNEKGHNVRIYNLGGPGHHPMHYFYTAKRTLPHLKPDLVIVNILQGNDLYQIAPKRFMQSRLLKGDDRTASRLEQLTKYFKKLYPFVGYILLSEGIFGNQDIEVGITPQWQEQGRQIFDLFTIEAENRFYQIDERIQRMFFDGQLNPKFVYDAVLVPDRFLYHENTNARETQRAIDQASNYLRDIKGIAQEYDCEVIVSIVPYPPFISPTSSKNMQLMGYILNENLLTSQASVEAVLLAAENAGIECISAVDRFRSIEEDNLYYDFDCHLNEAGALEYATFIAESIEGRITDSEIDIADQRQE